MTEERLSDRIEKLQRTVIDLEERIIAGHQKTENYSGFLPKEYKENKFFDPLFEQGTSDPHPWFELKNNTENVCYEKDRGPWPHLYHTFNPQLNNITDMILYIIQNCCCKKDLLDKKFLELSEELKEKNNFPEKEKDICINIDSFLQHLKNKQDCITIPDLIQYLQTLEGGGEISDKGKQQIVVPTQNPEPLRIKPPARFF